MCIRDRRKGALMQAKMSGNIGSLNAESTEKEVDEDKEIEVVTHHRNIGTIIDEGLFEKNQNEPSKSFFSKRLEKSAIKRLEKKRIKAAKKEMKVIKKLLLQVHYLIKVIPILLYNLKQKKRCSNISMRLLKY